MLVGGVRAALAAARGGGPARAGEIWGDGDVAARQEGAQRYVERFYADLGFAPAGETYLEDGIPHVEMTLAPPARDGG